jgi:hypothetical protein
VVHGQRLTARNEKSNRVGRESQAAFFFLSAYPIKATATKSPDKFEPVTLTITLQSQREVDAFHGIFNLSPVCAFFCERGGNSSEIRAALQGYTKLSAQEHDALRNGVVAYYK